MKIGKLTTAQYVVLAPGQSTDPEIVVASSLDLAKYTDITSISSWHKYGKHYRDYLYTRYEIMVIAATTGFINLSTEDKELASMYFAVSKTDRDTVSTDAEQQANWNNFVKRAVTCRANRWAEAKGYISYVLSMPDSIDLGKSADVLSHEYLVYGVEDFASDGVDGLFDWLEGTSTYVGGGYSAKSYWTQVDQDKIIDILRNGAPI